MHEKRLKGQGHKKEHKKRGTYGVESASRAGGAREAPGVRLRNLAL